MQEQKEIKEKIKLLKSDGSLNAVGWSRRCIIEYNKEDVAKKLRWRLKEWDFYQASDGEWMVQINFANITVGSGATCAVVNLKTGKRYDFAKIEVATKNRCELSSRDAESPSNFIYKKGKVYMQLKIEQESRNIVFKTVTKDGMDFEANLLMHHLPNNESISIVTPFDGDARRFFLTTKYNCMPTEGYVKIGDENIVTFDKEKTYSVLDWGRGVWPHKNHWYWGNGATEIDGKIFGFEITWGIGNTSLATETCVFYDGKAHKIGAVDVEVHPKINGWMNPWVFKDDQNKFNLTMTPFFDNESGMLFCGLLGMKTHQVHGYFNGTVTLSDGKVLEINNAYAFCEYVENLW